MRETITERDALAQMTNVIGAAGHPGMLEFFLADGYTLELSDDAYGREWHIEPTDYDVPLPRRVGISEVRELGGLLAWGLSLHRTNPHWSPRMVLAHLESYRANESPEDREHRVADAMARRDTFDARFKATGGWMIT